MANTNFRGPVNSMGSMEVQSGTAATIELQDGPSLFYQGVGVPDPRFFPFNKDSLAPGVIPAFLSGDAIEVIDAVPQAATTTVLSAAQVGTSATAVSLATTQVAGIASACQLAVGVPIIPVGTTTVTTVLALDFGFTTGTTVAASTTVTVVDNTLFKLGQWIIIGGAGNGAAQRSHICQVASISSSNTTTITIAPAAVTAISNAPIGQANLFDSSLLPPGSQLGPAAASANAHSFGGAFAAGLARAYNPRECVARTISLTSVTAVSYSCVVSGWDLYGNAMTEILELTSQTTMVGKKAFKYIGSITSGASSGTQQLSFGLGDTIGFPLRYNFFGKANVAWNNAFAQNSNGINIAVLTAANGTTGDVRGTIQLSTAILTGMVSGTAVSAQATNGTTRLVVIQRLGPMTIINTTPSNTTAMFGVAQGTATT